jgi:hypothetical protein
VQTSSVRRGKANSADPTKVAYAWEGMRKRIGVACAVRTIALKTVRMAHATAAILVGVHR